MIHRLEVNVISIRSHLYEFRGVREGDVSMTHNESLITYHAGNTLEYTMPKYPTLSVAQGCDVQGARRYCVACGQCASTAPEIQGPACGSRPRRQAHPEQLCLRSFKNGSDPAPRWILKNLAWCTMIFLSVVRPTRHRLIQRASHVEVERQPHLHETLSPTRLAF